MPKIVDHDRYREELMLNCFELFSQKGFSKVTMRNIAKELNVSTGTLYHYFPTKQALYEQMFLCVVQKNIDQASALLNDSMSIDEKLSTFTYFMEERKEYYQNILLLAIDFYQSNDQTVSQRVMEEFNSYYRHAIMQNLHLPEQVASLILLSLIGLVYQSLLAPKSVSFKYHIQLFKGLIESYLQDENNQIHQTVLKQAIK